MKFRWTVRALMLVMLIGGFATTACKKDKTSKIEPAARGQRGESCQARNDCASGLACIDGTCTQDEFPIAVDARHCDRIECETDEDCCGDLPLEAPQECADYDTFCSSSIPGCFSTSCDTDDDCDGGVCSGTLYCSNTGSSCDVDADCTDICSGYYCIYSGEYCTDDTDCSLGVCTGSTYCDCSNPDYDPSADVCTDPACQGNLCPYRCDEDQQCGVDDSCESDDECSSLTPFCVGGDCVECEEDADCDEDEGEECIAGFCDAPCTYDEECELMEACEDGECVYRGCESDRECVLYYARNVVTVEDARLYECLPSAEDPTKKECKVACENDGGCQDFEACDGGYCKFVGCTTDDECRWYFDLENEGDSSAYPWITRAVCRE